MPGKSPVRYPDSQHRPGPDIDGDVVVSIRAAVKAACTNIEKNREVGGRGGGAAYAFSVCSYANDVPTSKKWPTVLKPGTVLLRVQQLRRSQSSLSHGNKASCRPADLMLGFAWRGSTWLAG